MKTGTVIINISDLLEMQTKFDKLEHDIRPFIEENAKLKKEKEELEKLYHANREQIESLNKSLNNRKHADNVYQYIDSYHTRLTTGRYINARDFYKEFDAFMKEFIERKDKEAHDDLPF